MMLQAKTTRLFHRSTALALILPCVLLFFTHRAQGQAGQLSCEMCDPDKTLIVPHFSTCEIEEPATYECIHVGIASILYIRSPVTLTGKGVLDIWTFGKVRVEAPNGKLILDAPGRESDIRGRLRFIQTGLSVFEDYTLGGTGEVIFDGTNTVKITDTKELVHSLDGGVRVRNGLTTIEAVNGTAYLYNKGGIRAEAGGQLPLPKEIDLRTSPGDWIVSDSNSLIGFNRESLSLSGDFIVGNDGELDIEETVHTSGDLFCNDGTIIIDTLNGEVFRFHDSSIATDVEIGETCNCSGSSPFCP